MLSPANAQASSIVTVGGSAHLAPGLKPSWVRMVLCSLPSPYGLSKPSAIWTPHSQGHVIDHVALEVHCLSSSQPELCSEQALNL
jgi:hypothetical protein